MNIPRLILSTLAGVALMIPAASKAQNTEETIRPVTALYSFTAGSAHLTDTYLSPLKYSGWSAGLGYERWQAMKFAPERWSMNMNFALEADHTQNQARNATMWNFALDFSWRMFRRWNLPLWGLVAGVGPDVSLELGCLYTSRNGNNPASAKASFTAGAAAYLGKRMKLLGKVTDLRYVTYMPLMGAFFAPDYGELYYEIWLGNHSGLAHFGWPGNFFRWNNKVSADFHFGNTILSAGYRCDVFSSKVNHITTRIITHSFVFSIGGEWISLSPSRKLPSKAKIINAIY